MASDPNYIHTFTPAEQQRLIDQALFLEPYHHAGLNFSGCQTVLEVGCGVGAQMSILARRWPSAKLSGVDRSETQIARARQNLAAELSEGRVELHLATGDQLPFAQATFDAVCVFWVFEHVSQPLPILRDVLRVLKPGAAFIATEVFDQALHVYPFKAAIAQYFGAFTALQASFGGNPNVGAIMPGLLAQAGFTDVSIADVSPTLDARMNRPDARRAFLEYFQNLLLSGSGPLLDKGLIAPALVVDVKAEFETLLDDPAAVFSYGAKQIRGIKPYP